MRVKFYEQTVRSKDGFIESSEATVMADRYKKVWLNFFSKNVLT